MKQQISFLKKSSIYFALFFAFYLQAFFVSTSYAAVESDTQVVIENMSFSPEEVTVPVGGTVTWTNQDSSIHNVTSSGKNKVLKSDNLASGKSYSYTFTKPGIYPYFCSIHSDMMKGKVIVKEERK